MKVLQKIVLLKNNNGGNVLNCCWGCVMMCESQQEIKVASYLLAHCGALKAGERLLIIGDETTQGLLEYFVVSAQGLGAIVETVAIRVASRHGIELDDEIASRLLQADLVIALTLKSIAHTRARLSLNARGGRFLSLPGYTRALFEDPAIMVDYHAQLPLTRSVSNAFSMGRKVRVRSKVGTDIWLNILGREGNCCPGFVNEQFGLGSPPDIEANVSPIEDDSEGVVAVDGSVTTDELGLLETPIFLHVKGGKIVRFESENAEYVRLCETIFSRVGSPLAYVLAECGVGLNPLARLTGNMLTDEGMLGCVHFGFGSNSTVGGLNDVPFHLDFVIRNASLCVDDVPLLTDGVPV